MFCLDPVTQFVITNKVLHKVYCITTTKSIVCSNYGLRFCIHRDISVICTSTLDQRYETITYRHLVTRTSSMCVRRVFLENICTNYIYNSYTKSSANKGYTHNYTKMIPFFVYSHNVVKERLGMSVSAGYYPILYIKMVP